MFNIHRPTVSANLGSYFAVAAKSGAEKVFIANA
jgi:hypothetical protein